MNLASRACLIDASIYIFRAYFSLPDRWHSPDGWPLNAVYGYGAFLLDLLQAVDGLTHCAAAFDESLGSCFRNDIYPAYKESRELPDETLAFQLKACREVTERLGIPAFGCERYEADDYLASLARVSRERGISAAIVTRDKDLGQLLQEEGDRWWDFAAGVALDASAFTRKYGVSPGQFADYLALVGDPTDDIPGVPGVGAKTAARLLRHFGSLDSIERDMEQVSGLDVRGAARLEERLREHWPRVLLARRLTGLEDRVPGVTAAPEFSLDAGALADTADFLQELGLAGPLTARCWRLAEMLEAA